MKKKSEIHKQRMKERLPVFIRRVVNKIKTSLESFLQLAVFTQCFIVLIWSFIRYCFSGHLFTKMRKHRTKNW